MDALLWDVDTQEDFVTEGGALWVPNNTTQQRNMAKAVQWAEQNGVPHVASMDDHEYNDGEIVWDNPNYVNTFPPHCMRGTTGWEKIIGTLQLEAVAFTGTSTVEDFNRATAPNEEGETPREILLLKKNFDVFTVPAADCVLDLYKPEVVYVFGVALDICVNAAVNGLLDRGYKVVVIEDACAGLDPANTEACLANWAERGVKLIKVDDLP